MPGDMALACAQRMQAAPARGYEVPAYGESRFPIEAAGGGAPEVWGCDSISLVRPDDAGKIIVAASHAGMLGGESLPLTVDVLAATFNDAGVGVDRAGIASLDPLGARGIAAVAVAAESARIGNARSTYDEGVVSYANAIAAEAGVRAGCSVKEFVRAIIEFAGAGSRGLERLR
jgi:hypothetical protein